MQKIKKYFVLFVVTVSCLTHTMENANEQGQLATLGKTSMSYPDEKEEETIYPY